MAAAINLTDIEKEVLILKAIVDSIDTMVNFEVLTLHRKDPESETRFNSHTHQRFFYIVLVDLLSGPHPDPFDIGAPYAQLRDGICRKPSFDRDGSVTALALATEAFSAWLQAAVRFDDVWLPSISRNLDLSLQREEIIKICGDISKHNFSRLARRAEQVKKILERNGVVLSLSDSTLVLEDFYEQFHENILSYHGSTVAEFLNNVRWGIHSYLLPEFHASIVYGDEGRYRYTIPADVTDVLAQNCYWELMNGVRSEPYIPKFEITRFLKMRY